MAQVSHSTSQLHIATAFHFFSENMRPSEEDEEAERAASPEEEASAEGEGAEVAGKEVPAESEEASSAEEPDRFKDIPGVIIIEPVVKSKSGRGK